MSIQLIQKPSDIQPAQSPIVFSVNLSGSQAYTSSEFQYTANLYVWSGNESQSGSYIYQARKYPNISGSGIFDFSRMINSTLTDLSATNGSNIKYYRVDFGFQYESGSSYVTQSGALTPVTCSAGGTLFKAYDGYAIFPDAINDSLYQQNLVYYPFMTDAGIVTQSVTLTDESTVGIYLKGLSIWSGTTDNSLPTAISCSVTYEDGTKANAVYATGLTGSTTSSAQISHLPSAPGDSNWTTYWPALSSIGSSPISQYAFTAFTGSVQMSQPLNFIVECAYYYEPVRVAYKNRYGQFDFLNFYKRHNETFNTDQRLYQPQLGSWQSAALSYDQFQTSQQRYIVDATQTLECNTNWLEEGYNILMKQMMVSDEIYWCYDQANDLVKPLTIKTNSLQFKTGVNNKLIQYTITFDIGQPYKLLL
jgi:hypothetical protein